MADPEPPADVDPVARAMYNVDSSDPESELIDRSGITPEEISHIGRVMQALVGLRQAEQALSDASQRYMKLSSQDMRAIHYLMVARRRDEIVTPGRLAAFLHLSAASTTKLLNRLERGGHVARHVHPSDRRAFAIEVTPSTRTSAMNTVGRHQSRRFHAAARLSPEEREVVIRFLEDMTQELSLDNESWAQE